MSGAPRVIVVGAGAAGLACAIDLAASGCEVTLVDRASGPGGKIRTVRAGGLSVDAGPTVLTMRWVFDELFAAAGRTLDEHLALEPADVLARHAWPDGSRLDLFADAERSADAIGAFAGPRQAARYRAFAAYAARIYATAEGPFLRSQKPTVGSMLRHAGAVGLGVFARIDAHRPMARALEEHFDDPRLRQLFGRYATYVGSSPFEAPATFNLIAHVEGLGVSRVRGGMHALAASLSALARDLGVTERYDAEVARVRVRGGKAAGVELRSGEVLEADAVVCNTDVSAAGLGLLGSDVARSATATAPADRSLSAVTWALCARAEGFPLVHHNVFFSRDYAAEFADLRRRGRCPDEPTIYLCAQARGDAPAAIEADEPMLVILNAPATGDDPAAWSEAERRRCEAAALGAMERCGLRLSIRERVETTPVEFHALYPGTGGALYGPMARGATSSLARHGARSGVPRLCFAGGSVHPGPGVPMAALSGRLAAEALRQDLPTRTTAGWPARATAG